MVESFLKRTGLLLITALGLATAVFLVLIIRELFFQKPAIPPSLERDPASNPSPPNRVETQWPFALLSKPPMQPAMLTSDQDLVTLQLNNEGITYYTRGEYSEAVAVFQKAYERDPQNRGIRNNLAHAMGSLAWGQVNSRQYQDALLNFESAGRLKSDEPTLFLGQGLVYHHLHETDRAIDSLKRALALNPKMPEAYTIIGDIYYQADQIEMAVGYYEKGLELDSTNKTLQQQLAKAQREQQVQTGFQERASRAFTVKFEGREERDVAQRILQDLEEAYREVGKALSYYPQQPITVILYTNQQFRDVTRTPSWTTGLFDGKIRVPIGGLDPKPELLKKVLFHEYTHAVVFELSRGLDVPTWLNEGIAVYFESQDHSSQQQYLHQQLRSGQTLVPLQKLHGSFMALSDVQAALAYAESYSAVKTLVDRYGLYRIQQLLENLGNQKEFTVAFSDQFMKSYEHFQLEWQADVNKEIR